jgi:rhamnosyltransferase
MSGIEENMTATSIVIPTFNAGGEIRRLIETLRSQTISCEVLVVDSSSSDDTVGIAESLGAKTLIVEKGLFDHGGTRSRALEEATGDSLVFLTQDALPRDADAIERLVRAFEDRSVGACYGRQAPRADASVFAAHARLFNYPDRPSVTSLGDSACRGIKAAFLSNSFAAYRKSALREIGGFGRDLILGEDMHAGARLLLAGYKIAYVPDAVVYHSHNYPMLQEFKRYFDIGVFHRREKWILERFGRPEGEGLRYLQSELGFLSKRRRYGLIPVCLLRNALKYAGYRIGRHYNTIPRGLSRRMSLNRVWWDTAA